MILNEGSQNALTGNKQEADARNSSKTCNIPNRADKPIINNDPQ